MKEYLEGRIAELNESEERLYAQINQVVGMRMAFQEVLDNYGESGAQAPAPVEEDECELS
jgi:hypothetical protein